MHPENFSGPYHIMHDPLSNSARYGREVRAGFVGIPELCYCMTSRQSRLRGIPQRRVRRPPFCCRSVPANDIMALGCLGSCDVDRLPHSGAAVLLAPGG